MADDTETPLWVDNVCQILDEHAKETGWGRHVRSGRHVYSHLVRDLVAEKNELRETLIAVRDDLKLRAESDSDGTPVVAVGQSVWLRICDALKEQSK